MPDWNKYDNTDHRVIVTYDAEEICVTERAFEQLYYIGAVDESGWVISNDGDRWKLMKATLGQL